MTVEVMEVAGDLRLAARTVVDALSPAASTADWGVIAAPTDWTCRDALDHVANALCGYAASLASRSSNRRRHHPRNGDATATPDDLLEIVPAFATVLAAAAEHAAPEVRAFHPAGMADRDGFVAMGCDELLIHAGDVATAVDIDFDPPLDLVRRVVTRLFPWAPTDTPPWPTLLWANGRTALGDRARLDPNWWWHCAPLEEWRGDRQQRGELNPPGWR